MSLRITYSEDPTRVVLFSDKNCGSVTSAGNGLTITPCRGMIPPSLIYISDSALGRLIPLLAAMSEYIVKTIKVLETLGNA